MSYRDYNEDLVTLPREMYEQFTMMDRFGRIDGNRLEREARKYKRLAILLPIAAFVLGLVLGLLL